MPDDIHGNDAAGHERQGRQDRAQRQIGDAADAVAAGAAAAHARAEAHQEAAGSQQRQGVALPERHEFRCQKTEQHGPQYQSAEKGQAPVSFLAGGIEDTVHDAADAGHAAVEQQQRDGDADQCAARQGGDRGEIFHGLFQLLLSKKSLKPHVGLQPLLRAILLRFAGNVAGKSFANRASANKIT